MRGKKNIIYVINNSGKLNKYTSLHKCRMDLNFSYNTFYKYLNLNEPIQNKYFMGYDKAEVEQRAREYWSTDNTNTKELEDQVNNKIAEQNTVIEELMKQLKDQNMGYDKTEVEQRAREYWSTDNTNTKELEDQVNNKIAEQNTVIEELMKQLKEQNNQLKDQNKQLKEQNTLIQTLQNEITQLKQAPIQVQSIPQTKPIPETRKQSIPQTKPIPETRKPQIDQHTQPVKVEQNNVIPVSAPAGTIIPYSSLPVPPKYINPPMRRYAEVKVDGELWNWTNESFRVWYKNPVDQNFHFHYCQGYDFQDEWNVSDQRPYCYLPDGEMFDYRERDKDEEHRKKWAIISDERNGCKRWLEERAKLVNFFKKQIDISPKMKGFCVPNMKSIMEPVVETTNYKGVYKIYDYADFFLMRKNICNSAGGVLLDKNNCFVAEDNILLRTYKEVDGMSFRFPLANMNKDDKKILSELSYANIPSTIPLSANGVYKTVAHKLNDEIEKEYMNEEEEELVI